MMSATLHLGYGRTRTGHVGADRGFNAGALRTSDALAFGTGAQISLTGDTSPLACVQYHHLMEGRDIIRAVPRAELPRLKKDEHELPSLWPVLTDEQAKAGGYKWGMSIDLNACNGCNACVVVVPGGKQHSGRREGRGDARPRDALAARRQLSPGRGREPEDLFPAGAVHALRDCAVRAGVPRRRDGAQQRRPERHGLQPLRRHALLLEQLPLQSPPLQLPPVSGLGHAEPQLGRNPDVTVRSRGVMEKCTYCVQRISAARIQSEKEGRGIQDGEVKTACQSVCPAEAIVFGNLNDPNSRVSRLKAEQRDYALLHELNTRPRTTYLAAITERESGAATNDATI